MNWYDKFLKFTIKGTYTILAGQMAKEAVTIINTLISNNDIGNGIVARDIPFPSLKKTIKLEINIEEDSRLTNDFIIGGEYENEPTIDAKTNLVTDIGKETIFVNIYISPNLKPDRNTLYQELFYTIRHELEHSRDYAENKISQEELERRKEFNMSMRSGLMDDNQTKRYMAMVDYLLYAPEFQSIVRSIAYSAKKSGQIFEQLLRKKVYSLLYSNNNGVKNDIIKELGVNKITEIENQIINNFSNIQNSIFRRQKQTRSSVE